MSQTDALTGRRLTISDLGRGPRARQAAAPVTPKPATPARSATPAPPPKPAKAKAVQQKQPKSPEQMAKAAANIERDRQQHYEAIGRRAAARDANFAELRARFSLVFDPDRPQRGLRRDEPQSERASVERGVDRGRDRLGLVVEQGGPSASPPSTSNSWEGKPRGPFPSLPP